MTTPVRSGPLYDGDVLELGLTAIRPDGTPFTQADYLAHTARVDFFAPPKDPAQNPADRTVDYTVPLTLATDGLSYLATVSTAGWTNPNPPLQTQWTARYVITGQYAREKYLPFTLRP